MSAALDGQVSPARLRRLGAVYGPAQTRPAAPSVPAQGSGSACRPRLVGASRPQQEASTRAIAAGLGVAVFTVERAMGRAGIPRRRRGRRSHRP
jgi:hypothetical protein